MLKTANFEQYGDYKQEHYINNNVEIWKCQRFNYDDINYWK